jgi:sarcosine oxidase delta subunit
MRREKKMESSTDRRSAIASIGAGLIVSGLAQAAEAAADTTLEPAGGKNLREFSNRLAEIPRRRDYKTVPMIADKPDLWDKAALDFVMNYKGGPRQAWDHTDLTGGWLNGMRNTLNGQIYAFNQPDFLCVSGTHGPAHLALYDQLAWDKYQLAKIAGGNLTSNTFIVVPAAASHDLADIQSTDGAFSPKGNNVAVLQRRGVVFLACHNAIWELASRLVAADQNPDHLSVDAVAADLTNHLIANAVLTPGVVPTLLTLVQAGFIYTR